MRKTALFAVLLLVLSFTFYCIHKHEWYDISNVSYNYCETIKNSDKNIYAVRLRFCGFINGKAMIHIEDQYSTVVTKEIKDAVDFTIDMDWYLDSITIKYIPTAVSNGSLKFSCDFKKL